MILGTGVDITEVPRIRAAVENPRTGARFQARVFTDGEIAYCAKRRNGHESFAARFAAKEAMMKALGRAFGWREIEVVRGKGAPTIQLTGRARAHADKLGIRRIHLSLSHTTELALEHDHVFFRRGSTIKTAIAQMPKTKPKNVHRFFG